MPEQPLSAQSDLAAIRSVLAAYRSTEAHVTEEQITAAWAEFDALRVAHSPFHWPYRAMKAEAERDRYRDALENIVQATSADWLSNRLLRNVWRIARVALDQKQPESEAP